MSDLLIDVQQLCKFYQRGDELVKALDHVDLQVQAGEYIAILGPSGSGKSTLMNLLGCLDKPTSGHYYLDGEDVSQLSYKQLAKVRNQKIGFIFQGFHLLTHASAVDNVALPLSYRGISLKKRREKAAELLARVGLDNRLNHMPSELSGGQQQRVAVARALITDPQMILADEPTGNLDSQSGQQVMALFDELLTEGKTILTVTHDEMLAQKMKRTVRIADGKVQADE